jgi:hypothetical protein
MLAFRGIAESTAPALESMIHGVFVAMDLLTTDPVARSGTQLLRALGEFNEATARTYGGWLSEMSTRTRQAIDEGDVRADVDARAVGETIVCMMLGAELLSNAISAGADMVERIAQSWRVLLPSIVSDESRSYFDEFLARESLRQAPAPAAD